MARLEGEVQRRPPEMILFYSKGSPDRLEDYREVTKSLEGDHSEIRPFNIDDEVSDMSPDQTPALLITASETLITGVDAIKEYARNHRSRRKIRFPKLRLRRAKT